MDILTDDWISYTDLQESLSTNPLSLLACSYSQYKL